MGSFRRLIDYDVVVFVEGLPKVARQAIRSRLVEIRDHHVPRSDYMEHDAVGREVAINICGAFAVKFWVDHADRQIRNLDLHPADRFPIRLRQDFGGTRAPAVTER
ncbi:MAG: hypothetical protein EXS32_03100 [Opitutus sp.]|nr:hypothetical protein [Opitutus sp.]